MFYLYLSKIYINNYIFLTVVKKQLTIISSGSNNLDIDQIFITEKVQALKSSALN